jgi:ribonuclease T2
LDIRPADIIKDFTDSNKGLTPAMMSVECGGKRGGRTRLREVRICMDKTGGFTECGENERRSCKADLLVLPPTR